MGQIVVFGAGGRAGRRVVIDAAARGHQVRAVVRDPGAHADLAGPQVELIAGDVTNAADVARAAAGSAAAVSAVYRPDVASTPFYTAAADALVTGLGAARATRLIHIGIGTMLETARGVRLLDAPDHPAEYRTFALGHAAALARFEGSDPRLDWLVIAPPPVLLTDDEGTGRYRLGERGVLEGPETFSYADLARAVVDEIDAPTRHRVLAAVAGLT